MTKVVSFNADAPGLNPWKDGSRPYYFEAYSTELKITSIFSNKKGSHEFRSARLSVLIDSRTYIRDFTDEWALKSWLQMDAAECTETFEKMKTERTISLEWYYDKSFWEAEGFTVVDK